MTSKLQPQSRRGVLRLAMAALVYSVAITACSQTPPVATMPAPTTTRAPVALAINGFNYTDTVISEFYVDGRGGGNIYVSSPTSGGSGTSCCLNFYPSASLPRPVKIVWLRVVDGGDRWCEKTVQLNGPVPDKPTAFGVHFMPDGDVQVEVTQGEAKPRLRLTRFNPGKRHETDNVVNDERFAECRDHR